MIDSAEELGLAALSNILVMQDKLRTTTAW